MGGEQPMHARTVELTLARQARPLEHADDAPDAPAWTLLFGAQNDVDELGTNCTAVTEICSVSWKQRREATPAVGTVPVFHGARADPDQPSVWVLVHAPGRQSVVLGAVAVLEPSADEGAEHSESPKCDFLPAVLVHDEDISPAGDRPLLVGKRSTHRPSQIAWANHGGYMRRTPGASLWTKAAICMSLWPTDTMQIRVCVSTRFRRVPRSPTAPATAASTGISAVESVTTRSAALAQSRVNHRRRVRSGISLVAGAESFAIVGACCGVSTARSTVCQLRHR